MAELRVLGKIEERALKAEFGALRTTDVIVTEERIRHISARHPQDVTLFEQY